MALLTIYYETLLNITVSQQKPGVYSLVILVKLTIEIILTVVFIAYFSMSWEGRLYAWLISLMFSVILAAPYFHRCRFLTWNVRWSHYLSAIYFGLPLILHSIGKFIINQSDRIFITKMISIDEAGIYSIGYQVGTAVLLLVNAAGNFFQPYLYERLTTRSPKGNHEIVKTSYQLALLFILFQVLLWIGSPLLFKWLINPQYTESVKYIFWIGLGYVFWGLYIIMTGYIFYSGNNSFLGYLAIVNIILNIGLNYIMITHYGALGAAYATCISFFVVFVIVFVKANQLYPMPWLEWIKRKV
jgi:O-antigen/teichoic acid export membrane protein